MPFTTRVVDFYDNHVLRLPMIGCIFAFLAGVFFATTSVTVKLAPAINPVFLIISR